MNALYLIAALLFGAAIATAINLGHAALLMLALLIIAAPFIAIAVGWIGGAFIGAKMPGGPEGDE